MNQQFIDNIRDIVFIERQHHFSRADAVIYHPGHFPELNEEISKLYKNEGFNHLLIPEIYNVYLQAKEYDFHKPALVKLGIPDEIIHPIVGEFNNGSEVVIGAVKQLTNDMKYILLAGKAFFCRRFITLATHQETSGRIFDVLPLLDNRGIDKDNWFKSEKGKARVLNEIKAISNILNG